MKLGRLIEKLKSCKQDADICFDFCDCVPEGIDSYRGYYDQLAIGWKEVDGNWPKVGDVLKLCQAANGNVFTGYKGGEFLMDENTEVWVANYGRSHGTKISGVYDGNWYVVLETEHDA